MNKLLMVEDGELSSSDLTKKIQVITAAIDLLMASGYNESKPNAYAVIAKWLDAETQKAIKECRKYN
jgi:hypothetical protein